MRVTMILFNLLVTSTSLASASSSPPSVASSSEASVWCSTPSNCVLKLGSFDSNATAWALAEFSSNATGWSVVKVYSNAAAPSTLQAFAAGYVEAALSTEGASQQARSYRETTFPGGGSSDALFNEASTFVEANDRFMNQSCAAGPAAVSKEWRGRCLVWAQLDGLVAGHNAHAAKEHALNRLDFLFINGLVDLSSIIHKPFASIEEWTAESANEYTKRVTHCSSMVKVTSDFGHLYSTHNTWSGYFTMLRVAKTYVLPYKAESSGSGVVVTTSHFPGYWGTLSSQDDFYVLSNGLVVQETTNALYNATLASAIVPEATLTWVRTIVANREASDGASWATIFSRNNSGTINNQWMVIDYNKFTPHQPLKAGTLTILEQWPLSIEWRDMTQSLARGHWPSYNQPYFASGRNSSGNDAMEKRFGPGAYSYDLNPRAKMFRRGAAAIEDSSDLQNFMRYNEWETDPFSRAGYGGPLEGQSAENAIASRYDLVKNSTNSSTRRTPFGNTDGKWVDESGVRSLEFYGIVGPTHDTQPPFEWSGEWSGFPHWGQPERFAFDWVTLSAQF